MTHADRVREAKERVVDAAKNDYNEGTAEAVDVTIRAVVALLALEAETCPECGGTGEKPIDYWTEMGVPGERYEKCPAGCEQGRKR